MGASPPQALEDLVREYERRTNTHVFDRVKPLIDPDAVYWFSDGSHEGIDEIERAFTRTWNTIRDEVYSIADVRWLTVSDRSASCVYTFHWEGHVDGDWKRASGRGTSVFALEDGRWRVVHEHLSPDPA